MQQWAGPHWYLLNVGVSFVSGTKCNWKYLKMAINIDTDGSLNCKIQTLKYQMALVSLITDNPIDRLMVDH